DPSDLSRINMTDDNDTIAKKIQKARTDAEPLPATVAELEGRAEATNLVGIYATLEDRTVQSVLDQYAGQGFGSFKPELAELAVAHLSPIRDRYEALRQDTGAITRFCAMAQNARAFWHSRRLKALMRLWACCAIDLRIGL